jgi:hypothetical protein
MNVRVRVDALRDDPNVKGKLLSELFPQGFFNRFSYNDVEVRHCLHCKKAMTHNEMEPPDKLTPRAMHVQCFAEFTNGITEECPICGGYLSNDKVDAQSHSHYDIHHRICEGRCMDYFSLVSCKALGDDMSFLVDEQGRGRGSGVFQPKQTKDPLETFFQENIPDQQENAVEAMFRKYMPDQPNEQPPQPPQRRPFQPPTPPPQQRHPYQDPSELEQYRISQDERDYWNRNHFEEGEFDAQQHFIRKRGFSYQIFKFNNEINLTPEFNKRAGLIAQQNQAIAKYVDFCNQPIGRYNKQVDANGYEVLPNGQRGEYVYKDRPQPQQSTSQVGSNYKGKPVVRVPKKKGW